MKHPRSSEVRAPAIAMMMLAFWSCTRQDTRLMQHQQALESLASTVVATSDAWLSGNVSGTYTTTALERTYELVEQERSSLAASPDSLVDARGGSLSRAAEQMSRAIAMLMKAVRDGNATDARRVLTSLPLRPPAVAPLALRRDTTDRP